jgi:pimeloyl-ACP methyl ester carboxylesterase
MAQGLTSIEPFRIAIEDAVLHDLRARVRATRWPAREPVGDWQLGTDRDYLRSLAAYWANEFDWHAAEGDFNARAQFRAEIDGAWVHFVHRRARKAHGTPIILSHGWPSAFIEYLPVMDLLGDRFDVVVPSLPGYGFSERPNAVGVNYRRVASMWHQVMTGLGYKRYGVGGGDFGAGVASLIALDHPESVIGVHLTNFELIPERSDLGHSLTLKEDAFFGASEVWWQREKGYKQEQSTKPQTLSYALADSPVGLLAWILEKWHSWTDCGGDPVAKFGADFLLRLATLYWLNGSISTSVRDYYDNRWTPTLPDVAHRIERPTAFAVFDHHFGGEPTPPRSLCERLYNVTRWTEMARGGHFAPIEEPALVATDIAEFFGGLAS